MEIAKIHECATGGAELIVFPELFIPGYPYGMTYGFTVGNRSQNGRKDWKLYYDNSILAVGSEIEALMKCAADIMPEMAFFLWKLITSSLVYGASAQAE